MAKKTKKNTIKDDDLANIVARIASDAVGVSATTIDNAYQENFRLYMRKPMAGDERIKGRSKHVSGEVLTHVDWSTAQLVRVMDTQREPVSYLPNTPAPQDAALARQMTEVVNHILRQKNKHVGVLMPVAKNGFIHGLGVAMVRFEAKDEEGKPQLVKGLTDEQLVPYYEQEKAGQISDIEASEVEAKDAPLPAGVPEELGPILKAMQPRLWDIKFRKKKRVVCLDIVPLPPEDFIVSKDADFDPQTGGVKARLQGHKRQISRADLLEMGYEREKIGRISSGQDDEKGLSLERSEVTGFSGGDSSVSDDVTLYEIYTKIDAGSGQRRHYRFVLAGDLQNSPVLLHHEEVSKHYPYAAFCPYPTPNTLFGQGIAERIGPEQAIISKMKRSIFDNLNAHSNPIKIVNPEVTNVDDVLNLYPGAVVRSTDPTGGITYNQQQFTGMNAMPVIDALSQGIDFATGVGPSMIALNPGDMAETATAASQRANASQLFMELVCRWFAETFYTYLNRLIVDALVNNPEDAQLFIQRLTDQFVPIQIDDWDPDMDIATNVAFGVMNKDFNSQALNMILAQQMQAMSMGFVKPQQIFNTLTKIAENAGFTNPAEFYLDPAQNPAPPPQPPVDPNAGLIEIEKVKAQLKAQADQADREFEMRKLIVTNDLERDRLEQDKYLKAAEIQAKYGADIQIAQINAAQAAQRNDVDMAMAQQESQNQAMQHLAQMKQQAQQPQAPQQPPMPPQGQ
ncbi:portal protein [Rhizobium sp. XQZ8]|uniref:portal protein n=1 Tax=Rhizobium populisoli TaxID=2859785 RepID=UPI001CA57233|nr:portal protein [Rhizobium populisoli]MBW6421614.1 portal protein [Rhizobium populisoli]